MCVCDSSHVSVCLHECVLACVSVFTCVFLYESVCLHVSVCLHECVLACVSVYMSECVSMYT